MTGWPVVALADCCQIVSGSTPKTSVKDFWDGDIDWVTPADLSHLDGPYIHRTPRRITSAGLASCGARLLPAQSVLFSSRAPIGHVAINTVPMATNQGFKSLIPHADRVDTKYLFHWLRANRSYLKGLGNGATFKEVSKAVVARVGIPLPPLQEQRRIAAILDQADALRTKRREALAHLDDLTQAIFLKVFGDLREWPAVRLSEVVADLQGGKSLVAADPDALTLRRVLKISAVTSNQFRSSESKPVPDEHVPAQSHYVREGDLLISRANTTDLVGAVAYVWQTPDNLLLPDKLWRFRWQQPAQVDPLFVWALLRAPEARRELSARSSGTGGSMKNISKAKLMQMPVRWPPHQEQRAFGDAVRRLRHIEIDSATAAKDLGDLFASLQDRAFAGEL